MDQGMFWYRCLCGFEASARSAAAIADMERDHIAAASSAAVAALHGRAVIDRETAEAAHVAVARVEPSATEPRPAVKNREGTID